MNEGWIKLHRKVMHSGYYTDSFAVHLWIHLLLEASHGKKKTMFNGKLIELKEGQFITGRKKLSAQTGISEKVIRKWLNIFEINQQLAIENTSGGSCISILNYKSYQTLGQPRANDGPAAGQQRANDGPLLKELKNDKNVKNEREGQIFAPPGIFEIIEFFNAKGFMYEEEAHKFYNYYQANGWMVGGKVKMKDWKAAANNWITRGKEFIKSENKSEKRNGKSDNEKYRDWVAAHAN